MTTIPRGRSGYKPGHALVGEPTPQSHPERFSTEDIQAEIRHLLSLNKRYGSNPLRTAAYLKLARIIAERTP